MLDCTSTSGGSASRAQLAQTGHAQGVRRAKDASMWPTPLLPWLRSRKGGTPGNQEERRRVDTPPGKSVTFHLEPSQSQAALKEGTQTKTCPALTSPSPSGHSWAPHHTPHQKPVGKRAL